MDEFAIAVGSPRSAFANQTGHQTIIDFIVGEIRGLLETQLDPMSRQFDLKPTDSGSITKKMWFDAYTAARVIVDLAPGPGGETPKVPGGNGGGAPSSGGVIAMGQFEGCVLPWFAFRITPSLSSRCERGGAWRVETPLQVGKWQHRGAIDSDQCRAFGLG